MRTSKYQVFLNFVLGLLLFNALIVLACVYLLFYETKKLDEWGGVYASAIREPHAVELRKIGRLAAEDSGEAIQRASDLEMKLKDVAFNDFLWKTRRSNLSTLAGLYLEVGMYKECAEVLDIWTKLHEKDLDLFTLKSLVLPFLPARRGEYEKLLERASRVLPASNFPIEYAEFLANDGQYDKSAQVALRHLLNTRFISTEFSPWHLYTRKEGAEFSEKASSSIVFEGDLQNSKQVQIAKKTLARGTRYIRIDPVSQDRQLPVIKVELIHAGQVVQALFLSPEQSPELHDIKYATKEGVYKIVSSEDPYFIFSLEQATEVGTEMRVIVATTARPVWHGPFVSRLPVSSVKKAVEKFHWDLAPAAAEGIRREFLGFQNEG
ncbi:MAG: hypothetical protein P8R02_11850 [Pseudomonadales bacterium]|nr:hypothetical protein [Pseudomonadales bacterium]